MVNEREAETVRLIYHSYVEHRSVSSLAMDLEQRRIRSKPRVASDGTERGSRIFSPGAIAHILKNRIYLGQITHKEEVFAGEHPPIVERELWDQVQASIGINRTNEHMRPSGARSLLVSRLMDAEGRPMTPVHANKNGRRYRYYVTRPGLTGRKAESEWRVPAGEIEQLVIDGIVEFLRDSHTIAGIAAISEAAPPLATISAGANEFAAKLLASSTRRTTLDTLDVTVRIEQAQVGIDFALAPLLGDQVCDRHIITVPARLTRRGHELRLAYPPTDHRAPAEPDVKLVGLIAKAEAAHRELLEGEIDLNRRAHLMRLARLRYLGPDIVTAILDGRHPVELSARKLLRAETIPLDWREQRLALGFV